MTDSEPSPTGDGAISPPDPKQPPSKRLPLLLIAGGAVAFVVIALALGLGLGLGLGHHSSSSPVSSPSSTSSGPAAVTALPLPGSGADHNAKLEEWRLDPKNYILDMSWDLNAAPTTRHYDLVISEGKGWPDGE